MPFKDSPLAHAQKRELLRIRAQLGLTQVEAAKRIGDATNQWQRYEWGWRQAPLTWIRKVESKLRVTIDIRVDPADTSGMSADQRKGILLAVRKVRALLDDLVEETMGATPRVPAEVRGIHTVLRTPEAAPQDQKPNAG
jgi:hypothetical protein